MANFMDNTATSGMGRMTAYGQAKTGRPGGFDGSVGNLGGWDSIKEMLGNIFNQESAFGTTNTETNMKTGGWAAPTMGAIGSLGNAYMGMKQYGLAKDKFAESKRQFNKQYEASKGLTNERLESRHNRRLREGVVDRSTADYMSKYGVK